MVFLADVALRRRAQRAHLGHRRKRQLVSNLRRRSRSRTALSSGRGRPQPGSARRHFPRSLLLASKVRRRSGRHRPNHRHQRPSVRHRRRRPARVQRTHGGSRRPALCAHHDASGDHARQQPLGVSREQHDERGGTSSRRKDHRSCPADDGRDAPSAPRGATGFLRGSTRHHARLSVGVGHPPELPKRASRHELGHDGGCLSALAHCLRERRQSVPGAGPGASPGDGDPHEHGRFAGPHPTTALYRERGL